MLKSTPFLHIDADRVYDPLTDRALVRATATTRASALSKGERSGGVAEGLAGWVIANGDDLSRRSTSDRLAGDDDGVQSEVLLLPSVSIAPRAVRDPDALFARIVQELTSFRSTLQSVFLQSYTSRRSPAASSISAARSSPPDSPWRC